jgi:hypothetical protein
VSSGVSGFAGWRALARTSRVRQLACAGAYVAGSRIRQLACAGAHAASSREFAFLAQAEPAWSALRRRAQYDEDRLSIMKRKATTRKAKTRGGNLLVILGVALVVLLLLLRMIAFVAHGRRHY